MSHLKAKMHQILDFCWGFVLCSAPQTTAGFKGPNFWGKGVEGEGLLRWLWGLDAHVNRVISVSADCDAGEWQWQRKVIKTVQ